LKEKGDHRFLKDQRFLRDQRFFKRWTWNEICTL